MSIIAINMASSLTDHGPACAECGGPTRLVGIEPHPTKTDTDLRTYECRQCSAFKAYVVPLANGASAAAELAADRSGASLASWGEGSLPRFFFHFSDGQLIEDKVGQELADIEAAKAEAHRLARERLRAGEPANAIILVSDGRQKLYEVGLSECR
jgi:hypothetical protein